ncbi:hypothetical protein JSO54_08825 [Riemerella anatipestifer]|uniref:hypothetical protein n=1 Tax=Riemerella anatipestifer TaxID=34085 RepID=UPI0030C54348
MKTTATKLSVLAFLGLGMVAYGQSGKVGINTDKPVATLEIQPSTVNLAGTTNEGILAPKLSKTRVASIETPIEGTLVYIIDDATKTNGAISNYTGNDTKVAKITEKGYYYYNGIEWIKAGLGANSEIWAYNGVDKVYLKRSADLKDEVSYFDNGVYKEALEQAGVNPSTDLIESGLGTVYSHKKITSDVFSLNTPNTSVFDATRVNLLVKSKHLSNAVTSNGRKFYQSISGIAKSDNNLTEPIDVIMGGNFYASLGNAEKGSEDGLAVSSVTNVDGNIVRGAVIKARSYSSGILNDLQGTLSLAENISSGTTKNIVGSSVSARNYGVNTGSADALIASTIASSNSKNAMLTAIKSFVTLRANSTAQDLFGLQNNFVADQTVTINRVFGISLNTSQFLAKPDEFYGLMIGNSDFGMNKSFAIYTNKGENSFGDQVTIRKSGDQSTVLKFETERPWLFKQSGIAENANLHLKSTVNSKLFNITNANDETIAVFYSGVDLSSNKVGIGTTAPTEKLEVAGNVKATGFIGANAAIFPDYVFQKYYTGTSSLKADYSFKTLSQVEDFVKTNGHLPGYLSASKIKEQGYIDLMATQLTNVEKIEELYLHLLEKDKEVKELKAEITELKSLVKDLLAK